MTTTLAARKVKRQRKRKIQRIRAINRRSRQRRKQWKGKKLTAEEKKIRSEKLKAHREKKAKQKTLDIENKNIKDLGSILNICFGEKELKVLANTVGFIKRSSCEITAFSFVYIMSFGFLADGTVSLGCLTSILKNTFNIPVTIQGLSKRINRKKSVDFLKNVLLGLMASQLKLSFKTRHTKIFSAFSGVLLEDSSQITLNELLAPSFEGPGGGASKSSIKLNFIYDIKNFIVLGLKVSSGIVADKAMSFNALSYVGHGSLLIRDLGYFSMGALKKIQDAGAYYLSRLSLDICIYKNYEDENQIHISDLLGRLKENEIFSTSIWLGKNKVLKSTLIARKAPVHVLNKRIEKYKKKYRVDPPEYYVKFNGYSIFITNIPETIFAGKIIISLYKIRWQIELVFKNFKSNLEIDVLKGTNRHRIECLVYGRLIVIVTLFIIHRYSMHVAGDKEVSLDKLTNWLKTDNRLQNAVKSLFFEELLACIESELSLICKQKRTRKTSMEELEAALLEEKEDDPIYRCA